MVRGWGAAIVATAIWAVAPATAQTGTPGNPAASLYLSPAYSETADPAADLELARTLARASNRRILLEVGGDWCVWCHVLDEFLASDAKVRDALAGSFVVVKINWSPANRNAGFLDRYPRVGGYPHFFVLHTDGSFLASQSPAALRKGKSYNPKKMIAFASPISRLGRHALSDRDRWGRAVSGRGYERPLPDLRFGSAVLC